MSRIGKLPIHIPAGVTVTFQDGVVSVKGPKGSLSQKIDPSVKVSIENGTISLEENPEILQDNPKQRHAFHGLQGNVVTFELLHSHSIVLVLPAEIKVETKSERNKNPLITLESCDKQLLGQVCAKIRSFRKPEPYKGKGIKFVDEVLRRKSGKSAAAK